MSDRRQIPSGASLPNLYDAFAIRREMFNAVPVTDDAEVRALTLYDVVPAGHMAVPVTNSRWSPHLMPGEFAILEVADTEPQFGELYGLMIGTMGKPMLRIVQPYRSRLFAGCYGVMFRFDQPRRPSGSVMTDGPLIREHWHRTCRGRVVGVLALDDGEVTHG